MHIHMHTYRHTHMHAHMYTLMVESGSGAVKHQPAHPADQCLAIVPLCSRVCLSCLSDCTLRTFALYILLVQTVA